MGPQENTLKACTLRVLVDSCDETVEPFADRTKRIVIEGIHVWRLESSFRRPSVPALPYRCCPLLDRIAPRRKGLLIKQAIGDVGVPIGAQNRKYVTDTDKSGR